MLQPAQSGPRTSTPRAKSDRARADIPIPGLFTPLHADPTVFVCSTCTSGGRAIQAVIIADVTFHVSGVHDEPQTTAVVLSVWVT